MLSAHSGFIISAWQGINQENLKRLLPKGSACPAGSDGNEKSGADGNEESGADVNEGKTNFNASDASDMRGKEKNNGAYRKHSVISFIICEVLADVAAVALILLGNIARQNGGGAVRQCFRACDG